MRLNIRCHEMGGGEDGERKKSLALVFAQWTSNSSAGSRRGKDGKSGNRLFVQMKRENQNPRCNPSFQTAIFFSLSFHTQAHTCSIYLPLFLFPSHSCSLSHSTQHIQPSAHSRRLLHPVCLRKVDASPNWKF